MTKQIFYPKYALFICLYAIICTIIGTSVAKLMDMFFPKYDSKIKKSKIILLVEILIQLSLNCVIFYIMRVYTNALILSVDFLNPHVYGTPVKFAELIVSPTMFLAQQNLMKKIAYVWNIKLGVLF